jgi:thiol-disulfide isomerase/thioredoxin
MARKNGHRFWIIPVAAFLLLACSLFQSGGTPPQLSTPSSDHLPVLVLPSPTGQKTAPAATPNPKVKASGATQVNPAVKGDESPAADLFTVVHVRPEDGLLVDLVQGAAQQAQAIGRTPFVEFYANWCPPCNALRESLGDERMIAAFSGTYIIKVNVDEWRSSLPSSGFHVVGIPVFFAVDSAGKSTGRSIDGGAWDENIPENMAPPLKKFFHPE